MRNRLFSTSGSIKRFGLVYMKRDVLIYNGNITWMVSGIMDLKNLLKQTRNHK